MSHVFKGQCRPGLSDPCHYFYVFLQIFWTLLHALQHFAPPAGRAQEPFYLMCINPHFAFCPIFAIRWPSHRAPSNTKRHSEGTFTSDFTRYLDKMKAKDFVHWLINTKRYR